MPFFRFCRAVWTHWEARFGTTFAVILAVAQYLYLAFGDQTKIPSWVRDFPPGLWLAVGGLFFFWSCYVAWREEWGRVVEFEKKSASPDLKISIHFAAEGAVADRLIIMVGAQIRNPRGPQCSLYDWEVHLQLPDGQIVRSTDHLPPNPNGVNLTFGKTDKSAQLMVDKFFPLMAQVIPPGDFIEGWIWAAFQGVNRKLLYEDKARVVLSFKDAVSAQLHTCSTQMKYEKDLPNFLKTDWIPESARRR